MESFKAYRIFNENNKIEGRVADLTLSDLMPGEVVFKNAYSSVNYKDALAATGVGGKVIRKYPLVGGIDAAGVVVSSSDARFKAGDEVICTSYDFGVAHDGGYAQVCRVPADWVVPLPQGLTLFEAMVLGTAGFTAGLAVELLELNGLAPGNGKVLVNGATGGVASLAIDMLAGKGYAVTAITGKDSEHDFLGTPELRLAKARRSTSTWLARTGTPTPRSIFWPGCRDNAPRPTGCAGLPRCAERAGGECLL